MYLINQFKFLIVDHLPQQVIPMLGVSLPLFIYHPFQQPQLPYAVGFDYQHHALAQAVGWFHIFRTFIFFLGTDAAVHLLQARARAQTVSS